MNLQLQSSADTWFFGLLIAVGAMVLWNYISSKKGKYLHYPLVLRGVILLLLVVTLLHPVITRNYTKPKPLNWNIYLDNSMSIGSQQSYTLNSINSGIEELRANIAKKDIQLRSFHFAENIQSTSSDLDASGSATDLGNVIQHIKDNQNELAGGIIITDGQMTQGVNPKQLVSGLKIPLHVVGVGEITSLVDVYINSVDVPTVAVKGDMIEAKVGVTVQGDVSGKVNVTLYSNDKMVGSRFATVQGGGSTRDIRFRFKPDMMGKQTYQVRVSSFEDEVNVQNNRQNFSITVLKDQYKVALITGTPCYNTQVIKRIIREMDRIKIDHFIQFDAKFRPNLKTFWETPYDLIILDNFPQQVLTSAWQRIFGKKLVSEQSSLAWIIGPDLTEKEVKSLYPFFRISDGQVTNNNEPISWYFTDEINTTQLLGEKDILFSAVDQTELPPLESALVVNSSSPTMKILSSSTEENHPILLLDDVDGFRTIMWTSPDFYKVYYKMTGTTNTELAKTLWTGLFSWLMRTQGDKDMYFRLNKEFYQQGELIQVSGNRLGKETQSAKAALVIHKDEKKINSTQLHFNPVRERWEGQLWASNPGLYTYKLTFQDQQNTSTQTGTFTVLQSQIELNNISMNKELLSHLTSSTQGKLFSWSERMGLPEQVNNSIIYEDRKLEIDITRRWWLFILIVLLLTIEWSIRRKIGLP